jgi:26S proteasome regulatory subunit N12
MDKSDLETRCSALRLELKAWEKSFASQHDGRKAGREDIKANATICMRATPQFSCRFGTDSFQL